ncbi:MAG: family 16 glycosylhydrolase [Caulobacteraceae bacterium]
MSVDPNNLGGTAALTFNDDFNTLNLWNGSYGTWSTTFWYQDPNGPDSTIATTQEQEWYINANYGPTSGIQPWRTGSGLLALTATPTNGYTQSLIGPYAYTSGELNTYHSFAQTYGYFEIRAQLPSGQGFWPAFWLMPENGAWPPELDVLEAISSNPTQLTSTSHSMVSGMLSNNATVSNTTTGFHTYGMDWEPDFVTWYFDGQKVFQIATPSDMNQPMYMIVNLAVGGIYAGSPDYVSSGQMLVDYVRAYQAYSPGGGATNIYDASTDTMSANGNYALAGNIHNLTLTGAGQTAWGNSLDNVITSNNNNNILYGGDGNDTLVAGRGHDILSGGSGYDTFVYNGFPWNTQQITDFTPYQDQIDLRGMLASVGYTGSDPVGAGYLSIKMDSYWGTEVWFDPDGWGPGGGYWIFNLTNVQASSVQVVNDFIVGAGSSPNPNYIGAPGYSGAPSTPSPPPVSVPATPSAPSPPPSPPASPGGQTFTSDNNGDWWSSGSSNDVFNLGRGGDHVAGGGGADVFKVAEVPWAGGHITDFGSDDVLDLSAMFARYGYSNANTFSDGHLSVASDGQGGAQVWFNMNGLPVGSGGTWLVTTLDGVSPSSLGINNGQITEGGSGGSNSGGSSSGGSGQTYTSDNNGDWWSGTSGNDTFNLGRGGDVITGGGGNDTFKFAEVPWGRAEITDFHSGDQIDLSAMFARYGYATNDPVADGRLKIASDGAGGSQIWFDMDRLPVGTGGTWQLFNLDHVDPSWLHVSGAFITA